MSTDLYVAFELVKVRRQLEYSIAAAKGVQIVKPPGTWAAVQDIVRGTSYGEQMRNSNSPKGITALWTGMRLHLSKACYFSSLS
jgi:solute carrier family 25 carnitine/acylcarnitine transporter 20/29